MNSKNIMKRYLLIPLVILFSFPSTYALAHDLAVDGSISVIFHMDPDDDPLIGTPTKFQFEFFDADKKLDLTKCD